MRGMHSMHFSIRKILEFDFFYLFVQHLHFLVPLVHSKMHVSFSVRYEKMHYKLRSAIPKRIFCLGAWLPYGPFKPYVAEQYMAFDIFNP